MTPFGSIRCKKAAGRFWRRSPLMKTPPERKMGGTSRCVMLRNHHSLPEKPTSGLPVSEINKPLFSHRLQPDIVT